ncbi:hypothetical protein BH09BAC3_BH09BAC3_37400 [soil metagenome]
MNPYILSFVSRSMDVEIHQHSAYQIVFATENPFWSKIEGTQYQDILGFIIKPQVSHLCTKVRGKFIIINIEPDSLPGQVLHRLFSKSANRLIINNSEELKAHFDISHSISTDGIIKIILEKLVKNSDTNFLDERILKIMQEIRGSYQTSITTASLAAKIFLSPSRLTALFKEQTGSSLSKFLLWTRLKASIALLLDNKELTLTEIAHETGFYDSPNFTKYMHEMIGVPPAILRKNSDIIQVL